jgi:hypothetical protein
MTRITLLLLLAPLVVSAQTRESGPWWPNPEWGADDQAGASNRITPGKILEALALVRTGEVYEVGQVYEAGMPLVGTRTYGMKLLATGAPAGTNRVVFNDEFLATEVGQVGTQFDGLGHIGGEVRFADGTVDRVFYNGFTATEMNASNGLQQLGVQHVKPIITRGILVDLPSYKRVGRLAGGYEVTLADVRGALTRQGVEEESITPGDAVLFRYGWAQLWDRPAEYNGALPGIGLEVARWLVERKVTVIGADTSSTEVSPNPNSDLAIPVHQELMMKNGIFNIENMVFEALADDEVYEFLFIATPIRYAGATGSPLRPLAIR